MYLYLSQGVTVTCTGANAGGQTGAGAGIELAEGNALYLLGKGSVNAQGGNAADGCNGGNGGDAGWDNSNYWSGTGGAGGNGGGGAGAGIGTRGGQGGAGGSGAANKTSAWSKDFGRCGSNGEAGATAGAMGGLCVSTSFGSLTANGGAAASSGGSGGSAGKSALDDDWSYNYGAAGGGGGGGGGFGGAASNIGTGGPGGGGGGGGASGNLDWAGSGYWVVKAPGGKGGQNADETWAAAGAESILNYNNLNNGQAYSNSSGWSNYDSSVSSQGVGIGGSAGFCGNVSISESAISITTNTAPPTQEEWAVVCSQTNTSQSQWTALPFGTSMGTTIGTAGTTTYYYATGDRTFINANAGGSGLTILGTVYLFVASGQTITCKGANAVGQTGAGAGIELTEGNVLFLVGQGNVNATGGNAAGGGNGTNGSDAGWDNSNYWSGTGGAGGNGGGGAGAGIGTRGGQGGSGGAGAASVVSAYSTAGGGSGSAGQAGATAGSMGELFVAQSFGSLTATGGAAASRGGSAGSAGISILDDDTSNNYSAAGGGGGGGGGFGGAASNIGTGGPGGGGGGGGSSSNLDWWSTGYRVVRAPGGKGGQNVDGTWADAGGESILNYNNLNNGQAYSNSAGWSDNGSSSSQAVGTEGSGGAAGAASTSEQAITVNIKQPTQEEWDVVCAQTKTSQSQWIELPLGAPKGATIGTADATTYYYAMGDCTFTNSNAGGSGLTILGTVHLFIASGQTITCTGANASGQTGAGAGIELTEGNTLCLIGSGKIVATGGQAANGCNGFKGGDAAFKAAINPLQSNWLKSGDGGRGGDGGGGAGAGIGTCGGDGGAGGAGGVGKQEVADVTGNVGGNGANGSTAADMGTLYVYQMAAPTIEAHGGSSGTSGSGGAAGLNAVFRVYVDTSVLPILPAPRKKIHDGSSGTNRINGWDVSGDTNKGDIYSIGGGGGGGAGGFGGAASDIGTGGPGGGGGGGGASGSITYKDHLTGLSYYQVGALGGKGGVNADGTPAADGEGTMINSEKTNVVFEKDDYKDYTFLGWYNGDNRAAGGEGANPGAAAQSGTYDVIAAVITLADNADNSTTINTAYSFLANVTLSGRTLYKDGKWNTLCLPFSLSAAQIAAHADFAGATLMTLDVTKKNGFDATDGTLYLWFKTAQEIEAGVPYLVKWEKATGYEGNEASYDISNPVFEGVTISNSTAQAVESETTGLETVQMVGTYSPVSVTANDKSILFLGDANTLYYSTIDRQIRSCRAYFSVPYIKEHAGTQARAFALSFDGEETTGVLEVSSNSNEVKDDAWYSLDGVRLSGKPSQRGMYINKGKKILVK